MNADTWAHLHWYSAAVTLPSSGSITLLRSPAARTLLGNVSWSVFGGVLAAASLLACNIGAGRMVGPAEYGAAAFGIAMAQLVMLVVVSGMDVTSSRAIAQSRSFEERCAVVASSLASVGVIALAAVGIALLADNWIGSLVNVDATVIKASLLLAACYSVKAVADRQLAALDMLRFQAAAKLLEPVLIAALLVLLVWQRGHRQSEAVLWCFGIGVAALVALYLVRLRHTLRARYFDRHALSGMSRYRRVAMVSAIAPLPLIYGDKLAVQRALPAADVGLYMAYATSSFLVVAQLLMLVNNVLMPAISQIGDKRDVGNLATRVLLLGFIPVAGAVALGLIGILWLLGDAFTVDAWLVAGFATWSALHFLNGLRVAIVIMHSTHAYRWYVRVTIARSLAFIALLAAALGFDAVTAELVVGALVAAELVDTLATGWILRRLVYRTAADPFSFRSARPA